MYAHSSTQIQKKTSTNEGSGQIVLTGRKMSRITSQLSRVGIRWIYPLMLFAAFLVYQLAVSRYLFNLYYEGLRLLGAESVLAGLVPYRDFWTVYAPGDIYLLAALFKVFGSYVILLTTLAVCIQLLIVAFAFIITTRITSQRYGVLSAILLIAVFVRIEPSALYFYMPQLLALVACIWLFHYFSNNSKRNVAILGLIAGFSVIFKQDMGAYLFLALGATLAIHVHIRSALAATQRRTFAQIVRVWSVYILGALLVVAPVLFLLLYFVPLSDLIDQLTTFPRSIYPVYRALPPPALFSVFTGGTDAIIKWVLFYFPLAVFVLAALVLAIHSIRKKTISNTELVPVLLLLLGILSLISVRIRPDPAHLIPVLIPAVILFSWLLFRLVAISHLARETKRGITLEKASSLLYVIAVPLITALLLVSAIHPLPYDRNAPPLGAVPLNVDRAQGVYLNAAAEHNLSLALAFIQSDVPSNETIFVGNTQHQRIAVNNAMFYFLAGRQPATKYVDLHPGVATTAIVQNQIINDLNTRDTKYVVLWGGGNSTEPNMSATPSGVTNLDDFIATHFVQVAHYREYTIYARQDGVPRSA